MVDVVKPVDLVMWTRNGGETLSTVLQQIEDVIPTEFIGQQILVDDGSTDHTVDIAECFGWLVYPNPSTGVSSGAIEALRHVTSPYFASFEQDLFLSNDWWRKIPAHLERSRVAVASGIRFSDKPSGLRNLQLYVAKKYLGEPELSSWLRTRKTSAFTFGKTLDNTVYNTRVMRELGGFPDLGGNAGVDSVLAYRLKAAGYQWIVDYNVQSTHLRSGLRDELKHQYFHGRQVPYILNRIKEISDDVPIDKKTVVSRLLISPLTGVFVALKTRDPTVLIVHPLLRLFYAVGVLNG